MFRTESTDRDFNNQDVIGILVNRFWKGPDPDSHDFVMWFTLKEDKYDFIEETALIGEQNILSDCNKTNIYTPTNQDMVDHGIIEETGEPFVIYRSLLYADDFNPRSALFPRGSIGGFYMLPLNLPLYKRKGLASIRTISLTPAKLSTNMIFDYIIDDLIHAAVNGIEGKDPFGNDVRIFIDTVGFVADYPASSEVLDVMKHGATAPCTHCTFRRRRDQNSTRYGYSSKINSSNSSHSRGLYRSIALRSGKFKDKFAIYLGHNEGGLDDALKPGHWPLFKLGIKMLSLENKYTNRETRKRVHHALFDPYVQNIIAPDHCLTGLAKGILQTCFQQLPNDEYRKSLDKFICSSLVELGLSSEASIYNFKYKKIHSISMSYVYAILSIIPFTLDALNLDCEPPTSTLFNILRRLVSLTFWWPSLETDGVNAFEYVHGKSRSKYYRDLRLLAEEYIIELEKFCDNYPQYSKNLDKPNVHRMIELYMHTVVVFGHALFISEMLFEAAHQPLKFSLSKNTSKNAHITAVHHSLLRDWLTRLLEVLKMKSIDNIHIQKQASINLRYLMFGSLPFKLNDIHEKDFLDYLDNHINDSLDAVVQKMIDKWYGQHIVSNDGSKGVWTGHSQKRSIDEKDKEKSRDAYEFGRNLINRMTVDSEVTIKRYYKAVFKRGQNINQYKQHTLKHGDCFELFISNEDQDKHFIDTDTNDRQTTTPAAKSN